MLKCFPVGADVHDYDPSYYMNRPISLTHSLLMIAALTNPLCWLPCVTAAKSAWTTLTSGEVQGRTFTRDFDGKSIVRGALVRLNGPSLSRQAVTDASGNYVFRSIAPGSYRIDVRAPGLSGSAKVTVVSRVARDVPIQLRSERY